MKPKAQLWLLLFAAILCAMIFVGAFTAHFLCELAKAGWQLAGHFLKH